MKRIVKDFIEVDKAYDYCMEEGVVFVLMVGRQTWEHAFISDEFAMMLKLKFPEVDIYDEDDFSLRPKGVSQGRTG